MSSASYTYCFFIRFSLRCQTKGVKNWKEDQTMANVIPEEVRKQKKEFHSSCFQVCLRSIRTVFPKQPPKEVCENEAARLVEFLQSKYLHMGSIPSNTEKIITSCLQLIKQSTSVKSLRATTRMAKRLIDLYLDRYAAPK